MKFLSPLEQFELSIFLPLSLFNIDFSFTTVSFYLVIILSFLSLFFFSLLKNPKIVPSRWQFLIERLYVFILDLVREQTGGSGYVLFPIYFCIFCFILFSNLLGLIPFSFTVTAHIAITLTFALSFNLAFIILGFYLNGFRFLRLFVPSGAPVFLLPLIVIIELVSYLIRTLSLSVRLFANMMAGHTLLHILASFAVGFAKFKFPSFLPLLPLVMVFLVFFLELGIAFIQAYVFTILLCIYVNDSYSPVH